jgi:hypothetical protein
MASTRRLSLLIISLVLAIAAAACSIVGGSNEPERGAGSAETAARRLFDGLSSNDRDAALAVLDRDFAGQALPPDTFGVAAQALAALAADRGQQVQVSFRDLAYRTEPRRGTEGYAEVFVTGRMNANGRDVTLSDARLLTAQIGGRWYVTGAGHPFWARIVEAEERAASQPPAYVIAEQDANPNLPGLFVPAHPGPDQQRGTGDDRTHVANNVSIPICTPEQLVAPQPPGTLCYPSNPPASGPHAQSALNFRVYDAPQPKENLVHNMEHGGVIIWHNTSNSAVINELAAITNAAVNRQQFVLMTPYPGMEPETIALTAWTRLDKFPVAQFNAQRVLDFITTHHKRYNPEGF